MAQVFNAFVYGINAAGGNTEIAAAGGQSNGFPSANCHFYPTTEVRGNAQVTCNAVIELLPSGLNKVTTRFFTASTVAQLITAANA